MDTVHSSYIFHHNRAASYELSKQTSKQIRRCLISVFIIAIDVGDANVLGLESLLEMFDNEGSGHVLTLVL